MTTGKKTSAKPKKTSSAKSTKKPAPSPGVPLMTVMTLEMSQESLAGIKKNLEVLMMNLLMMEADLKLRLEEEAKAERQPPEWIAFAVDVVRECINKIHLGTVMEVPTVTPTEHSDEWNRTMIGVILQLAETIYNKGQNLLGMLEPLAAMDSESGSEYDAARTEAEGYYICAEDVVEELRLMISADEYKN